MSTIEPSGQDHQLDSNRLQNGSSSVSTLLSASAEESNRPCTNAAFTLRTDPALLRDVAVIVDKVRELERTVPCQLSFNEQVSLHQSLELESRNIGGRPQSFCSSTHIADANTHTMSSSSGSSTHVASSSTTTTHPDNNAGAGPDIAQQSSERLIIKLDGNKSSGVVMGDNDKMNSDSRSSVTTSENMCPTSTSPATMNDDEIKALVKELKRKIEFTERMNWLCLSRRWTGPPHRKTSLTKHQEVKKRILEICHDVFNDEVRAALRLPAFDCYEFDDASIICLMQTMFVELGLPAKFGIPMATLRDWLYEVYKHYNDVPFHNFRHCFCVTQMMYAITWRTDLVTRLGHLEVLILLVSCICHDLDHPGYNNIYQINARTELALRYNDISPLENHHCSIAFRLFEHPETNLFKDFSKEAFKEVREGIIRCILATDMARHNEIITQFKEISPTFDYTNKAHTNLLCMVLIKVADISNEARPLDVAEPWLDRLLQEFFAQSAAEKLEGLPVTPFMDPDKVSRTGSQVRFIGLVLLPLFETLGVILTELNEFIIQPARVALDYYKKLNESQARSRRSIADTEYSSEGGGGSPQMPRSQSGISVRSKKSIPSQKSASRTSVDEPICIAAELHDLPEGSESGDSETATEVDVAEKASKFKVDTESSGRSKSSQPPSRKTSKEKRPSMCVEMYNSSRIRGSYGNIHNNFHRFGANRAVSLDAQCQNRRMSSDGIQSVISDSSVFYHVHSSHNNCNNAIISNSNSGNNNNNVHTHYPSCAPNPLLDSINSPHSHDPDDLSSNSPNPPLILDAGEGTHLSEASGPPKKASGGKKKTKREFRFRSLRASYQPSSSSPSPQQSTTVQLENNPSNVRQFSAANASSSTHTPIAPGPRSFISRLRQLTAKFNFSFDHGSNTSSSQSSVEKIPIVASCKVPGTVSVAASNKNVNLRNAGVDSTKNLNNKKLLNEFGSKQICSIAYVQNTHPLGIQTGLQRSPNASKLKNLEETSVVCTQPTATVRNRAYSLDVPAKRYSSASSSRKSSTSNKNEEESFLMPFPNNNNGATCITCSYCSAELVINAENPSNGTRARNININVNNLSGCEDNGCGEGSVAVAHHTCTASGCDGQCCDAANIRSRKASEDDNELVRIIHNRMSSNISNFNNSSSNSNLSKNVNNI